MGQGRQKGRKGKGGKEKGRVPGGWGAAEAEEMDTCIASSDGITAQMWKQNDKKLEKMWGGPIFIKS
jgi:hypothetical protein